MIKRVLTIAFGLTLLTLFYAQRGFTQYDDEIKALKEDIKALKEGQTAIQKDLQEIKSQLKARQAAPQPEEPTNVVLSINNAPFKGDKNAKVTLIEFSDYQCPFCGRHARDTLPQIEADYIKTGKVKYVFYDFPLSFHENAFKAAEAAHCAGDQGKYWEMHDRLFNNQTALKDLTPYAQAIGLDMSKFQKCLDSGKYAAEVRKDTADGQNAGVSGTPTFYLGVTNSDDSEVKAVGKMVGAKPYGSFKQAIDNLLSSQK